MTLGPALALLNACLNATAGTCILLGYLAIRRGNRERHRAFMLSALGASTIFLASYLTRIALFGDTRFQGEGMVRTFYFVLLISHVLLAIAVVPLVLRTVFLAWKQRFLEHRRIAKITYPIWLYVSVTGVLVYLALYHWPA